jgi:predicted porin
LLRKRNTVQSLRAKFTLLIEFASPDWQNCNNLEQGLERAARSGCPRVKYEEEKFSMNKKLMAVAVAGALAAPGLAVAQVGGSPGVSLYGRLDTAVMIQKFTAPSATVAEVKKSDLFSPGNALGFRGREDLGGGTAAWFQLETGVWPDGRLDGALTNGQHFGGRNSGVGFSSSAGDVVFGIWDSPYKVAYGTGNVLNSGGFASSGIIMGNGDSTGALPNANCGTAVSNANGQFTAAAAGVCTTEATGNTTSWSRRNNNSIQYWSPVMSGVQFRLGTALANYQSPDTSPAASGVQKPKYYSGNVTFARGPLGLAAGYEIHEGFRPGGAAGVANPKDKAFQIGGKWDFGPGQAGVGYESLDYPANNAAGTNGIKVPAYVANARWSVGPGAVWGSYSKTAGGKSCNTGTTMGAAACGNDGVAKMTVLGYDYVMSKRTKMYVAYSKIDNGLLTSYYYIAGPAGNNGGGTAGAPVPGNSQGTASGVRVNTDVTSIGLGVQHSF